MPEREKKFDDLTGREQSLVEEFRGVNRGYGIPCCFCRQPSAEHAIADEKQFDFEEPKPEWTQKVRGARLSLWDCPGYVPANLVLWRNKYNKDKTAG